MTKKPNILFILTDQLRYDFLGCYGARFLKTPTIDSLAEQGTRFETCISASPICVPARASMLTGLDAHVSGVVHNLQWLRPDRKEMGVKSWPEHLNDAGYRTSAIGKMHFYPWDASEGFQDRIIAEDKRHIHIKDDYHDALVDSGRAKQHASTLEGYHENKGACFSDLPDDLQVDRWVGKQSANYVRNHTFDQPLALMVGFPGPHCPYDPPKEAIRSINPDQLPEAIPETAESKTHQADFLAAYKREWAALDYEGFNASHVKTIRQYYAAAVERIDADVAAILSAFEEQGELDNTIVIFTSDHGDYLGDFGKVGKATFHEPSIRVPMIVTDFRKTAGHVSSELTSLIDIYPSILRWAGANPDPNARGVALGEATEGRTIVGTTSQGSMVRNARWKLVSYTNGTTALFDLGADPTEQTNLIDEEPKVATQLFNYLTSSLVDSIAAGHSDLLVNEVKETPPHPFFNRDWKRQYPSKMGPPKYGK